jgi:GNAT superfamily N-acetyltransferase
MDIIRFTPDDTERVAQYADVLNAARAADSPWQHPLTLRGLERRLRHGWDGEVETPFVGLDDGRLVAAGSVDTTEWDNRHLAWVDCVVPPEHRRRGYGSQLFEALVAEARARGRTTVGADGWDNGVTRAFAARHGLDEASRAVQRRQLTAELDWDRLEKLHEEAADAASAYELVRREGPTPDDELDAVAEMAVSINDAPTDDLDVEDEVFPPERLRGYETSHLARGFRIFRILARHRETGELAGQTIVMVDGERPQLGDQHDTTVVGSHRGHRLGLLLKSDMNLWLREVQPQLAEISTWNAESNDHMIAVNDALGYRIMGRELDFQRTV